MHRAPALLFSLCSRGCATSLVDTAAPLAARYRPEAVGILDGEERRRLLDEDGKPLDREALQWELLYRLEPQLYDRVTAGERIHEGILQWLPARLDRVLEVGAGGGRLTAELAGRAAALTAVEPAEPLRHQLRRRLSACGCDDVEVVRGFFDALPEAPPYDLVISCSAFNPSALRDPKLCLDSLEAACVRGGLVVFVWPSEPRWLGERGYTHEAFAGPMLVEYTSAAEAEAIARIVYPDAVTEVRRQRSRFVDFVTLGINAPRDLAWKRVG